MHFLGRQIAKGSLLFILNGAAHFAEDALGEGGIKGCLATGGRLDSLDQIAATDLFQHVTTSAGADGGKEQFIVGIRGEHDDFGVGKLVGDLFARLDAAAAGEANVHEHDIGLVQERFLHRLVSGRRLCYNCKIGMAL